MLSKSLVPTAGPPAERQERSAPQKGGGDKGGANITVGLREGIAGRADVCRGGRALPAQGFA